jgi:hypothetical protein
VHWSREYEAWTHFGEIDFVVLNRSGEVLFIEQKNGALEEFAAGLIKHYGQREKNVVDQLHRSIDKVRQKYNWQHGRAQPLVVDYLIYCPDYRVKHLNAAGLNRERVVDAAAKDGLVGRIQKILGTGTTRRDGQYEQVEEFFYQTFDLVPDIHAHISSQERHFVRQSGALADILTHLEMEPFRFRLSGTAGSGKSLSARRFLEREQRAKRRVLLTCFNRPLAELLKASVGDAGTVNTFHGFCDDFLKSRGTTLDYQQAESDPAFWHVMLEQVMAEEIPEGWKYDSLIIDEGQDFEADWFEILRLFLREGGNILWLDDPDQNLQDKRPVPMQGFVRYCSRVNYRSPESIANFISDTLPIPFEQGNPLPGLGVAVHTYTAPAEQPKIVVKAVQNLVQRGFSHDDIVVLTCRGVQGSVFSQLDTIGGVGLRHFTGEYDSQGRQIMTQGKLTFESIYRFKGQEAPAVILVDVDPRAERREREERLLFCGMTRATVRLELVVNRENDDNRRFIGKTT